jgi:hypothetical protein
MHPSLLTVYKSPFKKIRVGKDNDGGYIIIDIPNPRYDILIAGGVDNDISFEEHFTTKYPNVKCLAFDGSVSSVPEHNNNITFVHKYISGYNDDDVTNLHDLIDTHNSVFIKMDIEGHEIPWIKSLNTEQLNKIEQITLEFHFPFSDNEPEAFEILNQNHFLVHFHPNNGCGLRNHNGINIPNVFECTYLHKKYFTRFPELNSDSIPSELDMKNVLTCEDIYINYPPFVNLERTF